MYLLKKTIQSLILFCLITPNSKADCVILLHGLARTSHSMETMQNALQQENYHVVNINYPSRKKSIEVLSPAAINTGLVQCHLKHNEKVHFVTHSMGGILIRYYLEHNKIERLGRIVMLAPPNGGSEVVDKLKKLPGFSFINGQAGSQLGTDVNSLPNKLSSPNCEVGIIAGTKTINPILSLLLSNPDDGKVSVKNTKLEGMSDFITVPVSHPFIMKNDTVIKQTIHFLGDGIFLHKNVTPS